VTCDAVGKAELEQLYEHWAKHAAANGGRLGKEHFADGLRQLGITDPLIVEQNFTAFDDDKDGCIDFREFVCGLSTILRGTTEERLRCTLLCSALLCSALLL
jgi:Ca2+-binding EF-hand superfamily protein